MAHRFKLYTDDGKLIVQLRIVHENDDMQNDLTRIVQVVRDLVYRVKYGKM